MVQAEHIEQWVEEHPNPAQWVLEDYMAFVEAADHRNKCRALQGLINYISSNPSVALWGLQRLADLDEDQYIREFEMCFGMAKRDNDTSLMLSLIDTPVMLSLINKPIRPSKESKGISPVISKEHVLIMCGLKKEGKNWLISNDNNLSVLLSPLVQKVFHQLEQSERFRLGATLHNPFLDALIYISSSNHDTVKDFYINYVKSDCYSKLFNTHLFDFLSQHEFQYIQPLLDELSSSSKSLSVYQRFMLNVWEARRQDHDPKIFQYLLNGLSNQQHEQFFNDFLKTIEKRSNSAPRIEKMDELAKVFPEHLKPWFAHQCILQLVKSSQFLTSQAENLILSQHTQSQPTNKRKL